MPRTGDWISIEPMRYGLRVSITPDDVTIEPFRYLSGRWVVQPSVKLARWYAFRILKPEVLKQVSKAEPQTAEGEEK